MRERRRSICTRVATLVAILLLPLQARAQQPQEGAIEPDESTVANVFAAAVDLVVVRPLGLGAVVVGSVSFLPVALISAPQGREGLRQAWEIFVAAPVQSVFQRPLGDF